jgi:hypothetical protein
MMCCVGQSSEIETRDNTDPMQPNIIVSKMQETKRVEMATLQHSPLSAAAALIAPNRAAIVRTRNVDLLTADVCASVCTSKAQLQPLTLLSPFSRNPQGGGVTQHTVQTRTRTLQEEFSVQLEFAS